MYILKKWLEDEKPIAMINEGNCDISGLRLFEEEGDLCSNYLYVGYVGSLIPEDSSHNILLMHHNDIIRLKNRDLNYIVNRILEAFEFFDDLEQRFFNAYYHECPEQEIISAVEHILGPCFIMQPDYKILACSQNFSPDEVNVFWHSFLKYREPSLQNIEMMKNSSVVRVLHSKPHMTLYQETLAAPYQYAIANTYQRPDESIIGFLIIASSTPITEYEKDMARILMTALNNLQKATFQSITMKELNAEGEILFANILKSPHDQRSRDILSVIYDMKPATQFRLLRFKTDDTNSNQILGDHLKREFQNVLVTVYNRQLVALIQDCSLENADLISRLNAIVQNTSIMVGISSSFNGIENSYYAMDQACFALESIISQNICFFDSVVVGYLVSDHPLEMKKAARHPAIQILETYDLKNETDLLNTLKQYLYCDRSVRKTSERMYIHKNTVLYRMNQIRDMCNLDLEDDANREYLILSLIIS